jgi:hypothetical protein
VVGVPFGIAIFVAIKLSGDTTTAALVAGAVSGLVLGVAVALASRKPRGEMRQILEQLPVEDWKTARTAAWRGPVPTRADLRATAVELVDLRLSKLRRTRTLLTLLFGFNLVLAVWNITSGRWWFVVAAVGWTAGLIDLWHAPRRLRRRRGLLTAE